MARARRAQRSASTDTRAKILAAAQETIAEEGIVGTSARAIAARGGFTQATIFYHFGGVDDLLVAVIADISKERHERYEAQLSTITSLGELVTVGRDLYLDDVERSRTVVLGQVLAGSTGDEELGGRLLELMEPWIGLLESTAQRVLGETGLAAILPPGDVAYAVSALFLGVEILGEIDSDQDRTESMFNAMSGLATLVDQLVGIAGPNTMSASPATPAAGAAADTTTADVAAVADVAATAVDADDD